MDNGNVLHARHDDVHVLRFIGDIRYTLSPSLERFLEGIFAGPTPAGFIIDLTETDSIDSTNLGLLARIANRMRGLRGPRVTVVSNRADINSVLTSMALDEVFDIVEDTGLEAGVSREVPQENADRETLARTLIDSHRALMDLSEHNREMFQDVVATLEKNGRSG
ncbi:MAG: STAS domain-containing protein [Gammaproteobacteria bacterium]